MNKHLLWLSAYKPDSLDQWIQKPIFLLLYTLKWFLQTNQLFELMNVWNFEFSFPWKQKDQLIDRKILWLATIHHSNKNRSCEIILNIWQYILYPAKNLILVYWAHIVKSNLIIFWYVLKKISWFKTLAKFLPIECQFVLQTYKQNKV